MTDEHILHWSPALSVGNADLDAQHIILLEIGREIIELLDRAGMAEQRLWSLLNDFFVISSHHDALEERILAQNGCPNLLAHQAAHTQTKEHIHIALCEAAEHCLNPAHLRYALIHWMGHHLSEMDLEAKPFLRHRACPPEAQLANDMALAA